MRTVPLGITIFLSLSLGIGCNNGSTSTPDLAMTADMAMAAAADMSTPPPDMAQAPPDMALTFHGCDDASFMDQSASGASRTVTFGAAGNVYSPKCILINRTQMVTFSGTFSAHPLRAGTVADQNAGTAGSPITLTNSGTMASFTFNTVGTFPYICTVHGAGGMTGVVRVK